MGRAVNPERETPYESATELREANLHLLEALNRRLGQDSSPESEAAALAEIKPQIRAFLERGAATGALVEDIQERTACQVLLDYWASTLSHAGVEVPRIRLAPFDATQLPDLKDKPCPFAGLDAFRDRAFFFGREQAVDSLLERVANTPLLVVQGTAGSGKSSIVMVGALPVLGAADRVSRYRIVRPFTPGDVVLERVAEAVASAQPDVRIDVAAEVARLRANPRHLTTMLGDGEAPAVLLVIDQFEEAFTLSNESDRNALAASIAELLQARPDDRVILIVRAELSGRLDELVALRPYLDKYPRFSMSDWPMGYEHLKAAVERPAALVNLQFQPGIVDHMVKSVLSSPDTAPALLQFALGLMWEKRDRNRITWDVYKAIGGSPLAALENFADGFYEGLASDQQRNEVKRILLELVRVDRLLEPYRHPMLRSRLLEGGDKQTADVLALLERNGLVRIAPASGGRDAVVEVKDEALVRNWPRYKGWIDAKRQRVRQRTSVTEAAQRWERGGKSASQDLLSGWQLQDVQHLPDLTGLEREYVEASRRAVERESNRRRRRSIMAAVGVVVFVFSLILAAREHRDQQRQKLLRRMAAANEASISGKLDHALTGAVTAARAVQDFLGRNRQPNPLRFEALKTLLSALRASSDLRRLFVAESAVFQAVAFHPARNDALVAFAGTGGKTYLSGLDEPPKDPLGTCDSGLVTALAFDPAGRWLAAACADGSVSIWSTSEWKQVGDRKHVLDRTIWTIAFSRDGRFLAAGGYDNKVKLIEVADDGRLLRREPLAAGDVPTGYVWSTAFSPTEDTLLVGDGAGQVLTCKPKGDASWDCANSKSFPKDKDDAIRAIVFSPDGAVALGHWKGGVDVFSDADLSAEHRIAIDDASWGPGPVYSLAFFDNCGRRYLAIGKGTKLLYRKVGPDVYGPPPPVRCIELPYASVGDEAYDVAFHVPSGLLAAATRGGYVALLDPARTTDPLRTTLRVPTKELEQVRGAIVAEEGETARIAIPIAPNEQKDNLEVLMLSKGLRTGRDVLRAGEAEISRVSASMKTRLLATLSRPPDAQVAVWRFAEDFREVTAVLSPGTLDLGGSIPRRIALSPDGQWLAISFKQDEQEQQAHRLRVVAVGERADTTIDGSARPRTATRKGESVQVDTGLDSRCRDIEIAFSPDGQFFAAGGDVFAAGAAPVTPCGDAGRGRVQLWKLGAAGFEKVTLPEDMALTSLANKVQEIAFARTAGGDRLLAAGGEYGEIDVWDAKNGKPLRAQRVDSRPVWLLAFSPQESLLAASDDKHVVRLWGLEDPESAPMQLSAPTEPIGVPGFLAFGANGAWLASAAWLAGDGGTLHLWDLDVDSLREKVCALLREPGTRSAGTPPRVWRAAGVCDAP